MKKVLLWFVSDKTNFLKTALETLDRQQNGIEFVGLTANVLIPLQINGKNIPFIPLDRLTGGGGDIDILLVVGASEIGMGKVTKLARQLNLPEEKLLGDWIVCVPGFTLEKYRKLQRSRLSIFSRNCFGGNISYSLGLPFRSPFVNLFTSAEDFIKFLRTPRIYIEAEPTFEKWTKLLPEAPNSYPVLSLGNISLHMLHYPDKDEAISKWLERKTRINWYNLIAIMFTEDEKILREFDALPYGKKICFVPFKSDLDSAWYINPEIDKGAKNFTISVDRFSFGYFVYYDVFDMLLYGKKTPLNEM